MQTFGKLTADILKINYNQGLEIDKKAWWDRVKDTSRTDETVSISLSAKGEPGKLAVLVNTREMTIELD